MTKSAPVSEIETATSAKLNAIRASALYAIATILICGGLIHTFATQYFAPGMTSARLTGIAGIVVFAFCAIFFKLTRRRRLSGALLLGALFTVTVVSALRNGGIPAPTVPFFAILPFAATILFNRAIGLATLLGVAFSIVFLFMADSAGWTSPSPHSQAHLQFLFASSVFITSAVIVIIALQYEKLASRALLELSDKAEQLRREANAHQVRASELKAAEERFTLAAKGASVGIWDWTDVNSDSVYWTDQLYTMLGYKPGDIDPNLKSFQNLMHPDDVAQASKASEMHFQKRTPFSVEYRLLHKDGDYRWHLATGQAVWDDNGAPRRMIGSIMNIDDRKRVEIIKDEFVSTVSHELRTPMTSVIGAIDMVRTQKFGELSPPVQKLLDIASSNGARLVRLVNDILDLSKLDAGAMVMVMEEVDLWQLLDSAIEEIRPFVSQCGANIYLHYHDQGVLIFADRDRLVQVLINLISNAAKFSGEGGKVDVFACVRDDVVEFSVADNGRGIPASKIGSIFNRFVQVDGSSTRDQEGTGLGLAICKAIVEAHDGCLEVTSELGEGATFTVQLPRRASVAPNTALARRG